MADVKPDIKPDSGQIELSVKSEDNVIKFKVGGCATRRMMMLAWWRAPYVRPLLVHTPFHVYLCRGFPRCTSPIYTCESTVMRADSDFV